MNYGKMELLLCVTFTALFYCSSSVKAEGIDCKMSKLMNAFSFDMQKSISRDNNDNMVFSPYSIYSALAMLSVGAKNTTKEQIRSVLNWKSGEDNLVSLKSMREYFVSQNSDVVEVKLNVANNGWVASDMNVLSDYQNNMNDIFGVIFQKENFHQASIARDNINQWVSKHTGKRILELFPSGSFSSLTKLVLANAIYFKGQWKMPFKKKNTMADKFIREDGTNIEKVKYMFKNGYFLSGVHRNVELLELPYGNDEEFTMLFAKPIHPDDSFAYEENSDNFINITRLSNEMNEVLLSGMLLSLEESKVDIYVPRFTVKQSFDLIGKLRSLGITDVFSPDNADLSGITGQKGLYVSSAQHKSYIEVDEKGTTAAGATGVAISALSMPPQIRLDRPFLFFILNKRCNSIIFAGKVMEPPV